MSDADNHGKLVYDQLADAQENEPHDPSGRFRLYECRSPGHSPCYVWERNPTMAMGRAAPCFGIITTTVDRRVTTDKVKGMIVVMSQEERRELLESLKEMLD